MKSPLEFDQDKLGTTTSDGKRIYLFLEEVHGKWSKYRGKVYYFLIAFYLILPWMKINGNQAFLIDISNREAFILGNHFYAHDLPLLFILLITFILLIGFLTSMLGRVWCGWACPQTVFIEAIFRKVEILIEGNYRLQKQMHKNKLKAATIFKKIIKWTLFVMISLMISHSFLAYFVRTEELLKIIQISPTANMNLFITMLMTTGIVLFDFGWFKEQFCIIVCPYGRMQSVLMDKDSLVVGYDYNRGEPRKVPHEDNNGDCVNCHKCVQVCPTGIDIRMGTQLECIHCTRCIDACDEIMDHIHKPRGLIRYTTERELEGSKKKIIRPRIIIYSVILLLLFSIGSYLIIKSKNVQVLFVRATRSPYQIVMKGDQVNIVNHYKAEFFYRANKKINLKFKTDDPDVIVVSPVKNLSLTAARKKNVFVFFKFNKRKLINGSKEIKVSIMNNDEIIMTKEMTLVGPYK